MHLIAKNKSNNINDVAQETPFLIQHHSGVQNKVRKRHELIQFWSFCSKQYRSVTFGLFERVELIVCFGVENWVLLRELNKNPFLTPFETHNSLV